MESKYHVLVIVDDLESRILIERALDFAEFRTVTVRRGQRGLNEIIKGEFHVAFMGLPRVRLRDDSVFKSLIRRSPPTPCIILAEDQREEEAVAAVQQGAYDYVLASTSGQKLRVAASRAITYWQLTGELLQYRSRLRQEHFDYETASGSSPMLTLKKQIKQAAGTEGGVIVEGEPGTGKRHTARTIHYLSNRQEGPFMELSCDLVPESLVESEFFGRETGMFGQDTRIRIGRIEEADGGTLYLMDIDKLHPRLQKRLLHTLKTGEVERVGGTSAGRADVRVIASTTADLEAAVYSGGFLKELYDSLSSLHLRLPPLRSRRDDIPILLNQFIDGFSLKHGRGAPKLDRPALQQLLDYRWPGNLEEMKELSEGLSHFDAMAVITPADLPERIRLSGHDRDESIAGLLELISSVSLPGSGIILQQLMEGMERALITKALDRAGGSQKEAAQLLGLKRTTLIEKIRKMGIR